jgi:hypothetical protein
MAGWPCFLVHKLRRGVLELDVGSVFLGGGGSCSAATVRGVARVSISKNLQLGRSFYRLVDHRGAGDPPPTNFEPNTR